MHFKIRLLAALAVAMTHALTAQNFSYTIAKDSSSYVSLAGAEVISAGENFLNKRFSVHLPFQFNFCGSATDSLQIEGNGFLTFNEQEGMALVAFNNFSSRPDTSQAYSSSILSLTEGSPGNRVVKIQFSHLAQYTVSQNDFLDYQVWLYENGNRIEFHMGANSFGGYDDLPQLLGIINRNMNTVNKAFLISGAASGPSAQLISGDDPFAYLHTVPSQGLIYKLTPSF
jgi:hypothetical protein